MDLDHTNLGGHCEYQSCHQNDFLPFKCDVCRKKFCLSHCNYLAHQCIGNGIKDMTSLDCPLCGKSVKFSKSDSADAIWNDHYATICTQTQSTKHPSKCYKSSCNINLGPSNSFLCNKCKQNVCLTHRSCESHDCKGMRAAALSSIQALPYDTKNINSTKSLENKKSAQVVSNAKMTAPAPSTPLFQPKDSQNNANACPFCSLHLSSSSSLLSHIAAQHPDITPAAAAPAPGPREVCPLCQASFEDAVQLVQHFQSRHDSPENQDTSAKCSLN